MDSSGELLVGILAFEVVTVMSRLVNLWRSLRDEEVDKLRQKVSDSVGLKKLVSDDVNFILGLIPGELFENVFTVAKYVARIGKNCCSDPSLKDLDHAVNDWINNGADPFVWVIPWEKMEGEAQVMMKHISIHAGLYDQMKLLSDLERNLANTTAPLDGSDLLELQNKVELKRHEVENLKEESLWNTTYDYVGILLSRSVFTIFSRIKHVFCVPQLMEETKDSDHHIGPNPWIFSKYKLSDAPPGTLGAAALCYANIVIQIESILTKSDRLTFGYRQNLFKLLPGNIRAQLSECLPSLKISTASLEDLAAEWKKAMTKTLEWLAPLAHATKKWHSRNNYGRPYVSRSRYVLLVQTLYFANQQMTEATIMELLVGLHYHCGYRKERERHL